MAKIAKSKFKVYKGVFDNYTLDVLEALKRKKYYDVLGEVINPGKEAEVYFASRKNKLLALKIYRLTNLIFKKVKNLINRDWRYQNLKGNYRKIILAWVEKEFRNLKKCEKKGVRVPKAYKIEQNVIILEYIKGPLLKDIKLKDPQKFFDKLLKQLIILQKKVKLIHGDLSQYNILVEKGENPVLIDFGQGIMFKHKEDFQENFDIFKRDLKTLITYFNKQYDLGLDLNDIIKKIVD